MAFPSSPTDGQTTTINGIVYIYSSSLDTWSMQSASPSTPAISTTNIALTGNITATGNVVASGNVSGVLISGTLSTAAQPNITSVGTLSAVTVTANANVGNVYATTSVNSPSFANGNSSVAITANANVGVTITSTSIATFSTSGLQITSFGVNTAPSGVAGEIRATGNITAGYSDLRLKDILGNIDNALDRLERLNGVFYTQSKLAEQFGYNDYSKQVGLIAQEVQVALPEAVKPAPFDLEGDASKSGENYLTVQYQMIIPLLVEAVKELKREIDSMKGDA